MLPRFVFFATVVVAVVAVTAVAVIVAVAVAGVLAVIAVTAAVSVVVVVGFNLQSLRISIPFAHCVLLLLMVFFDVAVAVVV